MITQTLGRLRESLSVLEYHINSSCNQDYAYADLSKSDTLLRNNSMLDRLTSTLSQEKKVTSQLLFLLDYGKYLNYSRDSIIRKLNYPDAPKILKS